MAGTSEATKNSPSADADDDRRAGPCGYDLVGVLAGERGEGKDSCDFADGGPGRIFEVASPVLFDEMGDDLGIRFGLEGVTFPLKLGFKRDEVLHDAVVDDDDVAGAIAVRMRVLFSGSTVGGPASVADTVAAIDGIEPHGFFQVAKLAGSAADAESFVVAIYGDSGRIVTAVFEFLQTFQDDRDCSLLADVADNAAHGLKVLDSVVFDDGIGENVSRDGFKID